MDSLRYWVQEMHVDGFRFDLAHHPGARAARLPPAAVSSTRAGKIRRSPGQADRRAVGHRARRLPGRRLPAGLGRMERPVSRHGARLLARRGRQAAAISRARSPPRPTSSTTAAASRGPAINFVTAHDGFTLNDLVSYNEKHNEANGEDNRDGHSHNLSCELRRRGPDRRSRRSAPRGQPRCATSWRPCCCRSGTPMLLGGDEIARTPGRQQQQLLPGQRDLAGSTGTQPGRTAAPRPSSCASC